MKRAERISGGKIIETEEAEDGESSASFLMGPVISEHSVWMAFYRKRRFFNAENRHFAGYRQSVMGLIVWVRDAARM